MSRIAIFHCEQCGRAFASSVPLRFCCVTCSSTYKAQQRKAVREAATNAAPKTPGQVYAELKEIFNA